MRRYYCNYVKRLSFKVIGRLSLLVLIFISIGGTIHAQESVPEPADISGQATWSFCQNESSTIKIIRAQFEQSYITFGGGWGMNDALLFESKIAPNLIIDCSRRHAALIITPKVVLRMFSEFSAPVKTPSYMPRSTLYLWRGEIPDEGPYSFGFLSVTLSHHSNGQSGEFFTEEGENNHEDGSFSTNYIDLAYHRARSKGNGLLFVGGSVEYHPRSWGDKELEGTYGQLRFNLSLKGLNPLGKSKRKTTIEGGYLIELTYLTDDLMNRSSALEKAIVSITYTWAFEALRDIGFFINYYYGQDYYNIRFDDTLKVLRVGAIINFGAMAQ